MFNKNKKIAIIMDEIEVWIMVIKVEYLLYKINKTKKDQKTD